MAKYPTYHDSGVSPEDCWKKNFRLSRDEFRSLLNELEPYISPDPKSPNYRALSACRKLAITLYYLKDTGSLSMTANSFGIAVCTASAVIAQVCKANTVFVDKWHLVALMGHTSLSNVQIKIHRIILTIKVST